MSDPIGCGYAISHFVDPFLLWLCGQSLRTIGSATTDRLYIFSYTFFFHMVWFIVIGMVMAWSLRDCGSIWLYDISLTHIRP